MSQNISEQEKKAEILKKAYTLCELPLLAM